MQKLEICVVHLIQTSNINVNVSFQMYNRIDL